MILLGRGWGYCRGEDCPASIPENAEINQISAKKLPYTLQFVKSAVDDFCRAATGRKADGAAVCSPGINPAGCALQIVDKDFHKAFVNKDPQFEIFVFRHDKRRIFGHVRSRCRQCAAVGSVDSEDTFNF